MVLPRIQTNDMRKWRKIREVNRKARQELQLPPGLNHNVS